MIKITWDEFIERMSYILEETPEETEKKIKESSSCVNSKHPELYSTKREEYFCPFCPGKPKTSPLKKLLVEGDGW